jgi:hypothetical protein
MRDRFPRRAFIGFVRGMSQNLRLIHSNWPRRLPTDLNSGKRVALGYESPLFVPANPDSSSLGRARDGECQEATGNRPFTAGAGAAILATGIQSLAWVLREIKRLAANVTASTRWKDFCAETFQLFVWEAFVSGSEKAYPPSHAGDAALAIAAFRQVSSSKENPTRIRCPEAFSLAGAAVVWAGLSGNLDLMREPCVVLRPLFSEEEAQGRLAGYKLRHAESAKAKATKKKGGANDAEQGAAADGGRV